jgi:hypothetical protein
MDPFSGEEDQLLKDISERRKQYLEKYGSAEQSFMMTADAVRDRNAPIKGRSESQIATNLFK